MMEDDRPVGTALVFARPQPRFSNHGCRAQTLCPPPSSRQVCVDAIGRIGNGPSQHIANHERGFVITCVLPIAEPINAVHDVFPTKIPIRSSNAFAFDDGVGVMIRRLQEDLDKKQRNVCQTIRLQRCLRRQ